MRKQFKNRERVIKKLVFKIIVRFIAFKCYGVFLSKSVKKQHVSFLHEKTAKQVGETMFLLEGVFVKVGQIVSTLSSFLPEVYVKTLEETQDCLKSKPFEEIELAIAQELNGPVSSVFKVVENKPLGVATIGQVHKAILLNGEEVVIKIQHKNIAVLAKVDLQILKKVLNVVKLFIQLNGFENVFAEVEQMILTELDYKKEALAYIEFKNNFKNDTRVKVPKVYQELSTDKILVLEYVEGEKITNVVGEKRSLTAEKMVDVFSKSVFQYGLYHADPHPGNVLVNKKGQLVFLDFGAVGHFNNNMRAGLVLLFEAILLKDENLMIAGLHKMKFLTDHKNNNTICKQIFKDLSLVLSQELGVADTELYQINLEKIDLAKVVTILKSLDKKDLEQVVNIPKEWVVLYRAITLTLGVSKSLAPDLDLYKIVKRNLLLMFTHHKKLVFKNTIQQQLTRLITLPRKMEVFMESFEGNAMHLNDEGKNNGTALIDTILLQILYVICAAISYHFYLLTNSFLFGILGSVAVFLFAMKCIKRFRLG